MSWNFYRRLAGVLAVLLLMVLCFVCGWECGRSRGACSVRVDTVRVGGVVYVPGPRLVETVHDTVPAVVDTMGIVRAYYARNVYRDTVRIKEYGVLTVTDTVWMNGLTGRRVDWNLDVPQLVLSSPQSGKAPGARGSWGCAVGGFGWRGGMGVLGSVRYRHLQLLGGYDFVNTSPLVGVQYSF
ncbi:MAG: hypothetical protein IJV06_08195 [Bacteroidaceae bacterium]|nr:hypothetical protein [Bacteroidaceae bacterium]